MVTNQFPMTSKDYPRGSTNFIEYTSALDKLVLFLLFSLFKFEFIFINFLFKSLILWLIQEVYVLSKLLL